MKGRFLLVLGSVALFSCGNNNMGLNSEMQCAVETVTKTTVDLERTYPATIKGKQDVEIRPQVSGFITQVCVDEGSTVRKGQTLFVVDPTQYEAAYRSAKAAVETAKANVSTQEITTNNKRELNKKNIISDYDLAMAENTLASAKAQLASAEAQLTSAEQNLSFTRVASPSNGVVSDIPYRLGALVSPSIATPLTVVSDNSEMFVYASLTEKELLGLIKRDGSQKSVLESYPEVKLQLSDGTLYGETGKIETISGAIDTSTGSVSIRATFKNPDQLLRSGGMANMVVPYHMSDVIVLPQTAFSEIQDKKFVFTLNADSTVNMTQVEVFALDDGKDYVVTSGLKGDERVVVENASILKDKQKIVPVTKAKSEENYKQALEDQKNGKLGL